MEEKSKQSPIIAYRLPNTVTEEQRSTLNKRIKDIAKTRKLNYYELFSLWAENDHLIGTEDVKQNMTSDILARLERLEESLTKPQLAEDVK